MRAIYHFTESLGGGVLTSIQNTTYAQITSNCEVNLIFLRRPDTPRSEELQLLLPGRILVELGRSNLRGYASLMLSAMRIIKKTNSDIYHAHSSKAGVCIRMVNIVKRSSTTYYTPHSYAHLRIDKSLVNRTVTKLIEIFLNITSKTTVVSCGRTEALDARKVLAPEVIASSNFLADPHEGLANLPERVTENPVVFRVASIGRITAQKGPERYVRVVAKLPARINAEWIGSGTSDNVISRNGLAVTGWLTQQRIQRKLAELDVLLITSNWEGLSMVGIEALSHGVPILSSNYHGSTDLVNHGFNGFICKSDEEFIRYVILLEKDRDLLAKFKRNARNTYLDNFDLRHLVVNWEKMYV